MNGNIFLRTSVCFLMVGIGLGMYMGATHNFTQAPTHAHINLVAGVWMFLAGLFYNAHPHISKRLVIIHYWLNLVAVLVFVPGIYAMNMAAVPAWGGPAVMGGSLLAALQLLYFAVMVFIGTGRKPA